MKTVTREDIALALSEKLDISRSEARRLVGRLIEIMGETLADGDPVKLSGFGTFQVVKRAARKGRNPRTGESVPIPAQEKIAFKASIILKSAIMEASASSPRKNRAKT